MQEIFVNLDGVEGMTVYVLYWRRPEEQNFTRVRLYNRQVFRDKFNAELLANGLPTFPTTWQIPPAYSTVKTELMRLIWQGLLNVPDDAPEKEKAITAFEGLISSTGFQMPASTLELKGGFTQVSFER